MTTHTYTGAHRHKQGWFHGELLLQPCRALCSEAPVLGLRVLIILFWDSCFVSEVFGMMECAQKQILGYTPPCIWRWQWPTSVEFCRPCSEGVQ